MLGSLEPLEIWLVRRAEWEVQFKSKTHDKTSIKELWAYPLGRDFRKCLLT